MANLKRGAAEKPATIRAKRARASKKNEIVSAVAEPARASEDLDEQMDDPEDNEDMFIDVAERLRIANAQISKRKTWAHYFEKTVEDKGQQLDGKIEDAKEQMKTKRQNFKQSMLPVLANAIFDLDLHGDAPQDVHLPLMLAKGTEDTVTSKKCAKTLENCETLLVAYTKLGRLPTIASAVPEQRKIFNADRAGLAKALEAAKKMSINQLQIQLANKIGESEDRFTMEEQEYHLARKILGNTKSGRGSPSKAAGPGFGPLIHEFTKVVGKMQNLA